MFSMSLPELFARAAFAKVKNPMRQMLKRAPRRRAVPHQGAQEIARRQRQIAAGTLHVS